MTYDFDTFIDRLKSYSSKWKLMEAAKANIPSGVVPMSTAEMEFATAPEILQGLQTYLENPGFLGYNVPTSEYAESVLDWHKKYHQLSLNQEWLVPTPGVLPGLSMAMQLLTEAGEGVIIFNPVYHAFNGITRNYGRKIVNIPLKEKDLNYSIDWEFFEQAAQSEQNKLLLMCNPHNPIGRVWKVEELDRVVEICQKHHLAIISDEMWQDWYHGDRSHHSMLRYVDQIEHLVVCTSPSKTFNFGGLKVASTWIANLGLRQEFIEMLMQRYYFVNIIGLEATRIAYQQAQPWFEAAKRYVWQNLELVVSFLNELPGIKTQLPEFGYSVWVDFRELEMTPDELTSFLIDNAQIVGTHGSSINEDGNGFVRLNIAMPRNKLQESLERLKSALDLL